MDVWYDRKLYWLTDVPLANKVTFEIPADSNFKAKEMCIRDSIKGGRHAVMLGGSNSCNGPV